MNLTFWQTTMAVVGTLFVGWFGVGTIIGWILGCVFGLGDCPWRK
jgi:hypothetical protein